MLFMRIRRLLMQPGQAEADLLWRRLRAAAAQGQQKALKALKERSL